MEEMTTVLSQLAEKLGTTSEFLWGVLIAQAPVSATITLIQIVLVVVFGIVLWKIHKWLMVSERYDDYEELIIPMIMGGIIFIILGIASFLSIEEVVNGYFNPEYWALKEIMDAIS